jgi:hypothetical protein
LRECPEMAVKDDWEEMARKELGCEKKCHVCCSYSGWYNCCIEILCQNTICKD